MENPVREMYDRLHALPFGKTIYSKFIGAMAPYTGTIGARVEELKPGYGKVIMADKKSVRNHLKSIHAIAMCNLAEITSGLSFLYGVPKGSRAILTKFEINFIKKARGVLTAQCACPVPTSNKREEYLCPVELRDEHDDVVAKAVAVWLVSPNS